MANSAIDLAKLEQDLASLAAASGAYDADAVTQGLSPSFVGTSLSVATGGDPSDPQKVVTIVLPVADLDDLDAAIDVADALSPDAFRVTVVARLLNDIMDGGTTDPIALHQGVTLALDGQGYTLGDVLAGIGGLGSSDIRFNGGITVLTAKNTINGAVVIPAGNTLELSGNGSIDDAGYVGVGGNLIVDRSGIVDLNGIISIGGSLLQKGSGMTILEGTVSIDGELKIERGSVMIGRSSQSGYYTSAGGSGFIDNESQIFLDGNISVFSAQTVGSGSVFVKGSIGFAVKQSYTGPTFVDGSLSLWYPSSIADSSVLSISSQGSFNIAPIFLGPVTIKALSGGGQIELGEEELVVDGSESTTYSGAISGYSPPLEFFPFTAGGRLNLNGSTSQSHLALLGASTYTGGTTITNGTLELGAPTAAGVNDIFFLAKAGGVAQLQIDEAALPANGSTFANRLDSFGDNDVLDLRGLAYRSGASAVVQGNTLTVSSGSRSVSFKLDAPDSSEYYVRRDGQGGVLVSNKPATGPNPVLDAPATLVAQVGVTQAVAGVSLSDPWAGSNPGTLALNLTASSGSLASTDAAGNRVAGSGTGAIHVSGTLAQLKAELANLTYTGGRDGDATITVDVWDQAGVEETRTIAVSNNTQVIDPQAASTIVTLSNATVSAASGNHMIFIAGSGGALSATGGTQSVQAYRGGNRITTGAGDDTIRFAGSGNTIDAGTGANVLSDSGGNNRIMLPGAGLGRDDIHGYTLQNGDVFDLRAAMAGTDWNGSTATLGRYLRVAPTNGGADLAVSLSNTAGGAAAQIALLRGEGTANLAAFEGASVFR